MSWVGSSAVEGEATVEVVAAEVVVAVEVVSTGTYSSRDWVRRLSNWASSPA